MNFLLFAILVAGYWLVRLQLHDKPDWQHLYFDWAIITVYVGSFCAIRMAQIGLYLYLFYSHLQVGVPRLVANSFTFLFATLLLGWLTSEIFGLNVTHLIATSAIFSVVLGLALQDTLGNLFSGFALQVDRPFGIGDWVEVQSGGQHWLGQIQEVNWRATMLLSFSDELISIPNKVMAQSQVLILSHGRGSARCHHVFHFDFGQDLDRGRQLLLEIYSQHSGLSQEVPPRVLITELADSWVVLKVFFTVTDYSLRYRIGDELLAASLRRLNAEKIKLARPKLQVDQSAADTEVDPSKNRTASRL